MTKRPRQCWTAFFWMRCCSALVFVAHLLVTPSTSMNSHFNHRAAKPQRYKVGTPGTAGNGQQSLHSSSCRYGAGDGKTDRGRSARLVKLQFYESSADEADDSNSGQQGPFVYAYLNSTKHVRYFCRRRDHLHLRFIQLFYSICLRIMKI